MGFVDERKAFAKLMRSTPEELSSLFTVNKRDNCLFFIEKQNDRHFIAVSMDRKEGLAPVNADLGFQRQAASNNYPELLDLGRLLVRTFGYIVNW